MNRFTIPKTLKCSDCGNIVVIHRKMSKNKKAGHLKKLYCIKCRKEVNHIELSTYDLYEMQQQKEVVQCS